jgi:hypothetical protein
MLKKIKRFLKKIKKRFFQKNIEFCFALCALGIVLGSAMTVPSFSLRKLSHLAGIDAFDPKVSIIVKARAYNPNESRRFLTHNLLAQGIQPVEITIENHTPRQYSLCPSSLDIPQITPDSAVGKLFQSTIPRQIAFKVIGFFFWPVSIPGTIDGLYLHISKKKLNANYAAKSLKKAGETVLEYSTVHRVIFVSKKDMAKEIEFDLIDLETFSQTELKTQIEHLEQS